MATANSQLVQSPVAVGKGTKKVILGEPAPFLKRIFNDLRTDFTAISAQGQFFNTHA
jgi:hypothetical protein